MQLDPLAMAVMTSRDRTILGGLVLAMIGGVGGSLALASTCLGRGGAEPADRTAPVTENRAEEINALHHIARAQRDLGALAEARAQVETAIRLIESTREQFASRQLRESYFATAQKSYSLYIDVLMLLHKQRPDEGLNTLALQVSERARARSFREMLVEASFVPKARRATKPSRGSKERRLKAKQHRAATKEGRRTPGEE